MPVSKETFEEAINNFKPEFGNENHLYILKKIENFRKKEKNRNAGNKNYQIEKERQHIFFLILN